MEKIKKLSEIIFWSPIQVSFGPNASNEDFSSKTSIKSILSLYAGVILCQNSEKF